jgi:hypothetical protein
MTHLFSRRIGFPLTLIGFIATSGISHATVFTATAVLSGWYTPDGFADSGSPNYFRQANYVAGVSAGVFYRDFFVFDLTGLPSGTISSATLNIYNPGKTAGGLGNGYQGPHATESLLVGSVGTAISLLSSGTGGAGVFSDFAAGTLWGAQTVNSADEGAWVRVGLNASFMSTADTILGNGSIALAGHLAGDVGFTQNTFIFGFSGLPNGASYSPVPELILDVEPVPEPSTLALGAFGALLGVVLRGVRSR